MLTVLLPLLATTAQPAAKIVDFGPPNRAEPIRQLCSGPPKWCLTLRQDDGDNKTFLDIGRAVADETAAPTASIDITDRDGDARFDFWTKIIELPDGGRIVGIMRIVTSMYSGGGGLARQLMLYRLNGSGALVPAHVLTVPDRAAITIRACFNGTDFKNRRGACHDQYELSSDLSIDPAKTTGPMPDLLLKVEATTFPAGVSRNADSLERGPLKKSDLVEKADPACTYRRQFRFDTVLDEYVAGEPLPDCSQYLEP